MLGHADGCLCFTSWTEITTCILGKEKRKLKQSKCNENKTQKR